MTGPSSTGESRINLQQMYGKLLSFHPSNKLAVTNPHFDENSVFEKDMLYGNINKVERIN